MADCQTPIELPGHEGQGHQGAKQRERAALLGHPHELLVAGLAVGVLHVAHGLADQGGHGIGH